MRSAFQNIQLKEIPIVICQRVIPSYKQLAFQPFTHNYSKKIQPADLILFKMRPDGKSICDLLQEKVPQVEKRGKNAIEIEKCFFLLFEEDRKKNTIGKLVKLLHISSHCNLILGRKIAIYLLNICKKNFWI